jgi:Lauroyl/myristoyl acyltransferase
MNSLHKLTYTAVKWALNRFGRISWKNLDRISGILYKLLYQSLEYRRVLVEKHLAQAFPDKTPAARKAIEKDFYQLFADWMMEVSFMHAQDWEAVRERFEIKNLSLFHEAHARGQSVIVAMGHQFNWEWGRLDRAKRYSRPHPLRVSPHQKPRFRYPFFAHAGKIRYFYATPGPNGPQTGSDAHNHAYADFDGRPKSQRPGAGRVAPFPESAHSLARGTGTSRTLRRLSRALRGNPPHSPASLRSLPGDFVR